MFGNGKSLEMKQASQFQHLDFQMKDVTRQ